jgi:sugar-specific transcriptional regulator TrmB
MRKMEIKNWVALIPLFCNADLEKKFLKSLSKKQSRIFIYLAERGEKTAPQIAKELKLPINDTRHILEVLQKKGTVTTSFKPPSRFKVVSRQEALERLSKESKK